MYNTKKNKFDINYQMFHPDGTLMCYIDLQRKAFYLDNNLADEVENGGIKLKFSPAGKGIKKEFLFVKDNTCTVSGTLTNTTKHHIVPSRLFRHFPIKYKDHNSIIVVSITRELHDYYNLFEDSIEDSINMKWDINGYWDYIKKEVNNSRSDLRGFIHMIKIKDTLDKRADLVPPQTSIRLNKEIEDYLHKTDNDKLLSFFKIYEIIKKEERTTNEIITLFKNLNYKLFVNELIKINALDDYIYDWFKSYEFYLEPLFLNDIIRKVIDNRISITTLRHE